jgi:hypothetical protein
MQEQPPCRFFIHPFRSRVIRVLGLGRILGRIQSPRLSQKARGIWFLEIDFSFFRYIKHVCTNAPVHQVLRSEGREIK